MIGRRQLPVASRVAPGAIGRAVLAALSPDSELQGSVVRVLRSMYGARRIALTDSGTSALVAALRLTVGEGGSVAFPGYACVDLAAAARFAGVKVRLYDIDPHTLGPDLDSLAAAMHRGVGAVVIAHLYGFPADVRAASELAAAAGIPIIEDAAQGAGGTMDGRLLGSFGALSILSFGRGKGTTGGSGGALLCHDAAFGDAVSEARRALGSPLRGWRDLFRASAQWLLGRPALYGLPSSIPALRLGEMVYHPAHEPRSLSTAAAALVREALDAAPHDVALRRHNAAALDMAAAEGADINSIASLPGAESGYLRFPVLDRGSRVEQPGLGILRGYPLTLHEQAELRPCLVPGEPSTPGASELARTLFTLPTHYMVRPSDIKVMMEWLRVPTHLFLPAPAPAHQPRAARSH